LTFVQVWPSVDFMKTNGKTLEPLAQAALLALYELGSAERAAHIGNVAARLGVSHAEATRALWALDGAGLVWAERCRLTIAGLGLAVRLTRQVSLARSSAKFCSRAEPRASTPERVRSRAA
jgi:DNA-binding MarR family transcriptional regulator